MSRRTARDGAPAVPPWWAEEDLPDQIDLGTSDDSELVADAVDLEPAPTAEFVWHEPPARVLDLPAPVATSLTLVSPVRDDVAAPADPVSSAASSNPRADVVGERELTAAPAPAVVAALVHDPAAAQLAACFAIDYLSWDQHDSGRRELALRRYVPVGADPVRGWSGRGRQRATFAMPGRVSPGEDPSLLWVDVEALVTRYEVAPELRGSSAQEPARAGELPSRVSAAPAPDAPGWRALDSEWIPLSVPVRRLRSGRLVIDQGSEQTDTPTPDNPCTRGG